MSRVATPASAKSRETVGHQSVFPGTRSSSSKNSQILCGFAPKAYRFEQDRVDVGRLLKMGHMTGTLDPSCSKPCRKSIFIGFAHNLIAMARDNRRGSDLAKILC